MILRDKYILILVSHVLSYHPILINPSFHGKICLFLYGEVLQGWVLHMHDKSSSYHVSKDKAMYM